MLVLSAMKMETTVAAPSTGRVDSLSVKSGDDVEAGVEAPPPLPPPAARLPSPPSPLPPHAPARRPPVLRF